MAVSVNWATGVIFVPKLDLTLIQSNPIEIRELDVNDFRLQLKDLEDDLEGMPYLKTHTHNTEVSLGGITLARVVEILDPYTITFENGQYAVNLVGANNNIADKLNLNQVSVRSANSAGLISNTAIEFASFNGGVIVDTNSGVQGTTFPRGTEQMPVDNLDDALLIASYRGFKKLYLHSDITLNSGSVLTDFVLEGISKTHTFVSMSDSAQCYGCHVTNCDINGVFDGDTVIERCTVGDLSYFNGRIFDSGLYGTITLGGSEESAIVNCFTVDQDNPPVINMGGGGNDLAMPNYSGIVTITNLTSSTDDVGIGLNGGLVILDSSVTAGTVIISGVGLIYDYSTGSASVNIDGLLNKQAIASSVLSEQLITYDVTGSVGNVIAQDAYGGIVYFQTGSIYSGNSYPIGTVTNPVNNYDDLIAISEKYNASTIHIHSNLNIPSGSTLSHKTFEGHRTYEYILSVDSGSIIQNSFFKDILTSGSFNGTGNSFIQSKIGNATNLAGDFISCMFSGSISLKNDLDIIVQFDKCHSGDSVNWPAIDLGNNDVQFTNYLGLLRISNFSGKDLTLHGQLAYWHLLSGCITGSVIISGQGRLIDQSDVSCSVSSDYMYNTDIQAEKVWDSLAADHTDSLTMGGKLNVASAGGVDYGILANAIWSETTGSYSGSDSFGYQVGSNVPSMLDIITGLAGQKNFRITNQSYNANGSLLSATLTTYPSSVDTTNQTNALQELILSASYDGNDRLIDYYAVGS